jgi:hypothetical protein
MTMGVPSENQEDFWEFALNPDNRRKMDIIAKGAEIFVEELKFRAKLKMISDRAGRNQSGSETLQNIEYEAYPMDTFSVIVSFNVRDLHISLNLEEIRFLRNEFEANLKIYIWKEENGERKMEKKSLGTKKYELKLEEVENSFREMYEQIKNIYPTIGLP